VKLDPHLSPLRGEMTSAMICTPTLKMSFNLYSDAVDRDPTVKRFSATIDWNDCIKGFQGQVASAVMNRKEWSVYWKSLMKPQIIYVITIIFVLTKKLSTRHKEERLI
jgi:hypothetical protein